MSDFYTKMFTDSLERYKEIGVMKAIGAKNSDILVMDDVGAEWPIHGTTSPTVFSNLFILFPFLFSAIPSIS